MDAPGRPGNPGLIRDHSGRITDGRQIVQLQAAFHGALAAEPIFASFGICNARLPVAISSSPMPGSSPTSTLSRQKESDLLWIREEFLSSNDDFGKIVIHGHTPTRDIEVGPNRINIDTGAFATGRLTCLVIDEFSLSVIDTVVAPTARGRPSASGAQAAISARRLVWQAGHRCALRILLKKLLPTELIRMCGYLFGLIFNVGQALHRRRRSPRPFVRRRICPYAFDDRFGRPAPAEGNDRTSARHRFDRHHPEILLAREDQRAASRVMLLQDVERLRAHHRDGRAGNAADLIEHLAAADHHQIQVHFVEGADREIRPLVGDEFARHQIIVAESRRLRTVENAAVSTGGWITTESAP